MSENIQLSDCFRYDPSSRSAICRISENGIRCKKKISNNHHGNKMRHLKTFHRSFYDRLKRQKRRKKIRNFCGKISIKMDMDTLYAAFVELVSLNGRPLCICDDSGIRLLINPILDGIYESTGEKYYLNSSVIKEKLEQAFEYVRNEIIQAIKNRPLALMADTATKHNYSLLGINIRYCTIDLRIFTRTIGMVALSKSHTAENLYSEITAVLNEYKIKPNQILSYTTDNVGNIMNVVNFLNNDCEEHMMEQEQSYDSDQRLFELLNYSFFTDLLNSVQPMLERQHPFVESVPCGAHTTQLSIKDSLKEPSIATEIQFVKEKVKMLRTPTMANLLKARDLKQAVIDHEIRWNYTYLMCARFIELRGFVDEIGQTNVEFKVSPEKWTIIELITQILREPYNLTMALQRKDYVLSDFYGDWLKTKMNLKKLNHPFAMNIVENMTNRETRLMDNKLMLSAVYLDPRYNMLLTDNQVQMAERFLLELHCRVEEIDPKSNNSTSTVAEPDDFQRFLLNATKRTEETAIFERIKQFRNKPAIDYRTKIFNYWEHLKIEETELFKLAIALFTVAVTQVDVERAFSSLTFIFNHLRSNMKTPLLSKILILRSNADLFPKLSGFFFNETVEGLGGEDFTNTIDN